VIRDAKTQGSPCYAVLRLFLRLGLGSWRRYHGIGADDPWNQRCEPATLRERTRLCYREREREREREKEREVGPKAPEAERDLKGRAHFRRALRSSSEAPELLPRMLWASSLFCFSVDLFAITMSATALEVMESRLAPAL
jgi:hypothetical protein